MPVRGALTVLEDRGRLSAPARGVVAQAGAVRALGWGTAVDAAHSQSEPHVADRRDSLDHLAADRRSNLGGRDDDARARRFPDPQSCAVSRSAAGSRAGGAHAPFVAARRDRRASRHVDRLDERRRPNRAIRECRALSPRRSRRGRRMPPSTRRGGARRAPARPRSARARRCRSPAGCRSRARSRGGTPRTGAGSRRRPRPATKCSSLPALVPNGQNHMSITSPYTRPAIAP